MLPENEHEDYSQYSENVIAISLKVDWILHAHVFSFFLRERTSSSNEKTEAARPLFTLKFFYFFCLSEARIRSLEMFPFSSPPSFEARIRATPKKIRKHMKLKGSLAYVESSKNSALRLFN